MGGYPYFSHLSSPPPPGSPIYHLIHLFEDREPFDSTIPLYIHQFSLFTTISKRGKRMKKILPPAYKYFFYHLPSAWKLRDKSALPSDLEQ